MQLQMTTIAGKNNRHKVELYALSTCVWCKKTRQWLEDNEVEYDYIYVDLLDDMEQENVMDIVIRWNPQCSFPTLVIDDEQAVCGFRLDEIGEVLL